MNERSSRKTGTSGGIELGKAPGSMMDHSSTNLLKLEPNDTKATITRIVYVSRRTYALAAVGLVALELN
ncbi:unnamed protein product, partial [Brenthis ino]